MTLTVIILSLSIIFQGLATSYSLRFIKKTYHATSWILITIALVLMIFRRSINLFNLIFEPLIMQIDLLYELIGLILSLILFLGIKNIGDVSIQRMNAEDKRNREGSDFKLILNSVPIIIFYKDRKGRFLRVNKEFADQLNMSEEEFLGKTVFDLYSADIAQSMANDDQQVIESSRPKLNIIEQYESKQGKRWVKTDKIPIFDVDGKVIGLIGFAQDITKQKKIEEEVAYLASFPDLDPDPICEIDSKGNFIYRNPAFLELEKNGTCPCNLTTENIKDFYSREYKGGMYREIKIDDTWYLQIIQFVPKSDNLRIYNTDITELKRLEKLLIKDKDALEELVKERTAELMKSQKKLEDARRLSDIGLLAATIAHELRNPLGVIKTAIYNIERKKKDSSFDTHLANINKKISESDQIIRNLLSYSKIKMPYYQNVDIDKVISECIKYCKDKYAKWDVKINVVSSSKGENIINADPDHMSGLFLNILDNAYQAFPDKAGLIQIKLSSDKDKNQLNIEFNDNGVGIGQEDLKKVFDPFFTNRAKGIGLGLTVCQQIANIHNGSINIQSQKEKGTTVYIQLPIRKYD